MNTTITSKETARGQGLGTVIVTILALVAVVGTLAIALYMSGPRAVETTTTGASVALLEQRRGEWSASDSSNAPYAYMEQRRGEWGTISEATAQDAYNAQRHEEWGTMSGATAQDAYIEQRHGEWGVYGAADKAAECSNLLNKNEQARCVGIR